MVTGGAGLPGVKFRWTWVIVWRSGAIMQYFHNSKYYKTFSCKLYPFSDCDSSHGHWGRLWSQILNGSMRYSVRSSCTTLVCAREFKLLPREFAVPQEAGEIKIRFLELPNIPDQVSFITFRSTMWCTTSRRIPSTTYRFSSIPQWEIW